MRAGKALRLQHTVGQSSSQFAVAGLGAPTTARRVVYAWRIVRARQKDSLARRHRDARPTQQVRRIQVTAARRDTTGLQPGSGLRLV